MKRVFVLMGIICLLLSSVVIADDTLVEDVQNVEETIEELYADLGEVALEQDAGITPDSPLYFIDEALEKSFLGNDPARALKYKEEKIQEALYMLEKGDATAAQELLAKAQEYGKVLESEVSPELEQDARKSSKAILDALNDISESLSEEEKQILEESINEHIEQEVDIAAAAKVAKQVKELCESLATLDPNQYAKVCSPSEDAPQWLQNLDDELSKDQEDEAKGFFETMNVCFENPSQCDCSAIGIDAFETQCSKVAPLAAACEEGDEDACAQLDLYDMEDMLSTLPKHLQIVLKTMEARNGPQDEMQHMPAECRAQEAQNQEDCEEVLLDMHAPSECKELLDSGELSFNADDPEQFWKLCDELMFELHTPDECKEAGVTDPDGCAQLMFTSYSPQECLDAGLDGTGRDDQKECDQILRDMQIKEFQETAAQECLDAGITGHERDPFFECHQLLEESREDGFASFQEDCASIEDPMQRLACYDGTLEYVGEVYFEDEHYFEDVHQFEPPQEILSTPECSDAGITDVWDCEELLHSLGPQDPVDVHNNFQQGVDGENHDEEFFGVPSECETENGPLDPQDCDELLRDLGIIDGHEEDFDDFEDFKHEASQEPGFPPQDHDEDFKHEDFEGDEHQGEMMPPPPPGEEGHMPPPPHENNNNREFEEQHIDQNDHNDEPRDDHADDFKEEQQEDHREEASEQKHEEPSNDAGGMITGGVVGTGNFFSYFFR